MSPIILCDAHVHVYPGADVSGLLDAAAQNFKQAAARLGAREWRGVLMLTEVAGVDWFGSVAGAAGGCEVGAWRVTRSPAEPISLQANASGASMTIVAGRQIVTAERLEVHALGTCAHIADGADIHVTLDAVRQTGALVVLPWGVGKWLGTRGRLVEAVFRSQAALNVYAADNGGRPAFWPERRFELLHDRPLLRGSDPLPLPGEEYRVGGFGSWFAGSLSADTPAASLRALVAKLPAGELHAYGSAETASRFFRNQLLLRWRRF